MDRGVAFKFEYLGNTTLKKLDGLASVQTMLRDMYALHRKCDSKDRQQREITSTVLQTTDEGLYIRFRRKNTRTDEEVFYSAPSILLWEAVRFRHIVGDKRGKKVVTLLLLFIICMVIKRLLLQQTHYFVLLLAMVFRLTLHSNL